MQSYLSKQYQNVCVLKQTCYLNITFPEYHCNRTLFSNVWFLSLCAKSCHISVLSCHCYATSNLIVNHCYHLFFCQYADQENGILCKFYLSIFQSKIAFFNSKIYFEFQKGKFIISFQYLSIAHFFNVFHDMINLCFYDLPSMQFSFYLQYEDIDLCS